MVFAVPRRIFASVFLQALIAAFCCAQTSTSKGVQFEFPAGGVLRIDNQFGSVTAETWAEKFIYVTTDEQKSGARGPSVVIENKPQLFVVRVMRRPGAAPTPIALTIKIPETAKVEIFTGGGSVS